MRILRAAKKGTRQVQIELDNGSNLFLAYEVFLKSGLRKDDEISEDRFSFLVEENRLFYIKQRAFRLLGRRLHSEAELRRKLTGKDYPKYLIDRVVDELIDKGYLNDREFAKQFADEKIKGRLWGGNKIASELFRRGIEREIVYDTVSDKLPEESSLQSALLLAEKKLKLLSHKNLDSRKLTEKIITYLMGKGYDYDTAKEAAGQMENKK